jgi:hypothetical protein
MKILNRIFVILCLLFCGNTAFAQPSSTDLMSGFKRDEIYQKDSGVFTWGQLYTWLFRRSEFNKSYALIIGIGDYNEWPKLESPSHDATRMRDFLIEDADFDYVITLTDARASKERINALMEDIFPDMLTEDDRFLFYFSGHGTQRQIGDKLFGYLVLQDSGSENSYGSMLNMLDIERWDSLIYPTRHALFILDSCFSGIAGQQPKSPLETKKIERLSQYGHHLITAGTADEESIGSLKNWGGSLFTYAFLEAVRGKGDLRSVDYDADGIVSLKELMKYVEDYIDHASVTLKAQHPLSKKEITMSPQISNLQQNKGEFFFINKSFKEQNLAGRDVSELTNRDLQVSGEFGFLGKGEAISPTPSLAPTTPAWGVLSVPLRSNPLELSTSEAREEFDLDESGRLENYIKNDFEDQGEVVIDRTTGLMWQKSGSKERLTYVEISKYVESLNRDQLAGYNDWRQPTMPELLSLMEPTKQSTTLYINPIFDVKQTQCWSADKFLSGTGWSVDFYDGDVDLLGSDESYYVRAVRTINN